MEVDFSFSYIHFIISETSSSNLVETYISHIGQFSQNRNPAETAEILKTKFDFEIYSIFVGNPDKNSYGMDIMEQIASKTENESHFFWIRDEWVEDQLQKKINNSQTGGYHPFVMVFGIGFSFSMHRDHWSLCGLSSWKTLGVTI